LRADPSTQDLLSLHDPSRRHCNEGDCCAHHDLVLASGNRLPFVSETAGSGDRSGHHFFVMEKPAVAARKLHASILPAVCRNEITSS
jgi:hypothetical protein